MSKAYVDEVSIGLEALKPVAKLLLRDRLRQSDVNGVKANLYGKARETSRIQANIVHIRDKFGFRTRVT